MNKIIRSGGLLCPKCGSADCFPAANRGNDDVAAEVPRHPDQPWWCCRCEAAFTPQPCPACGGYRREGATAISGAPLVAPAKRVRCWDCKAESAPSADGLAAPDYTLEAWMNGYGERN